MAQTQVDTQAEASATTHTCDLCGKSYQRRDLLSRHRRRCSGPAKPFARQKACHACVQAKTKCSYSQPSCARCTKRGITCQYPSTSTTSTSRQNASKANDNKVKTKATGSQNSDPTLQDMHSTPEALQVPSWSGALSNWNLDAFDSVLPDGPVLLDPSLPDVIIPTNDELLDPDGFMNPIAKPVSVDQSLIANSSVVNSTETPINSDSYSNSPSTLINDSPPSSSQIQSRSLRTVLGDYPSQLLREEFATPLLHWSLYSDGSPDISILPRTSMALACGRGMQLSDSYRFMQRVMDAERHRLIEDFPSFKCIKQWDALHAMMIYEFLELRDGFFGVSEAWKQKSRTPGLRTHFLLKMAKCYSSSYAELRNPNYEAFSNPASTPFSDAQSAWTRWRVTETARRTLFLVNIINWYGNSDFSTGKLTPYYEAFDDNLISNMPLPCSQQAWIAQDEEQWHIAIQKEAQRSSDPNAETSVVQPCQTIRNVIASYISDGVLVRKFTRDDLHNNLGETIGFEHSDQFRSLIVLCACEQFA